MSGELDGTTEVRPYPIDVWKHEKGDWLTPEQCESITGVSRNAPRGKYQLRLLGLRQSIERAWERERDEVITTAVEKDGIRILTDEGAVSTNERRSIQRIRGLASDLAKQNGVDRTKLTDDGRAKHEKALTRLGAFLAGGRAAVRAALKPHKRTTPVIGG